MKLSVTKGPGSRYSDSITTPYTSKTSSVTSKWPFGFKSTTSQVEHQSKGKFAAAKSIFEGLSKSDDPKPTVRSRALKNCQQNEPSHSAEQLEAANTVGDKQIGGDISGAELNHVDLAHVNDCKAVDGMTEQHPPSQISNQTVERTANCQIQDENLHVSKDMETPVTFKQNDNAIENYDNMHAFNLIELNAEIKFQDKIMSEDYIGDLSEESDTFTVDSGVHLDKNLESQDDVESKVSPDNVISHHLEGEEHDKTRNETVNVEKIEEDKVFQDIDKQCYNNFIQQVDENLSDVNTGRNINESADKEQRTLANVTNETEHEKQMTLPNVIDPIEVRPNIFTFDQDIIESNRYAVQETVDDRMPALDEEISACEIARKPTEASYP